MLKKRKAFQISSSLKEGLEDTIKAAENYGGQLRVEAIPLRKIELDPDNPRELMLALEDLPEGPQKSDAFYDKKKLEKQSLETIAASIKNEGVINPIVVYKFGEKYRVVAGERRTLASKLAGKSDIPAKILNAKPTELKLSILQWIENIEREDLTLWERLRNLEKIIVSYKQETNTSKMLTATEISRLLGCSLPHAMNYLLVLNADSEIRTAIQNNQLRNLEKAALIAKIETPATRGQALKACIEGASMNEIKNMATIDKKIKNEKFLQISASKKGRQAQAINLGSTKNFEVARLLMNAVLNHSQYRHLETYFTALNWEDYSSVSRAFSQLIKVLEESVS